jgi:hypothetical protein
MKSVLILAITGLTLAAPQLVPMGQLHPDQGAPIPQQQQQPRPDDNNDSNQDLTHLFPPLEQVRGGGKYGKGRCHEQCAKAGAACTAACLTNVVHLTLGNLVPCLQGCGTASAACHNAVGLVVDGL